MRQALRAGALGRPRGIGWRGRQEGGSGWGTHINPWLIHVNVGQKPLQYCKVISLQLIKINEKQINKLGVKRSGLRKDMYCWEPTIHRPGNSAHSKGTWALWAEGQLTWAGSHVASSGLLPTRPQCSPLPLWGLSPPSSPPPETALVQTRPCFPRSASPLAPTLSVHRSTLTLCQFSLCTAVVSEKYFELLQ